MKAGTRKNSAVEMLHRRYIGDNESRKASIRAERINVEIAKQIYEIRKEAGLSQKALADLVGTTQSVISRLEDADYEGHSLSMLSRIADALGRDIIVSMPKRDGKKIATEDQEGNSPEPGASRLCPANLRRETGE